MSLPDHEVFCGRPFKALVSQAKREGKELFLVGGFLRDLSLGRRPKALDLDFTLAADAIGFGRRLARRLKAGFVVLDREHGCSRVVVKEGDQGRTLTLDFVDFRGKDLPEDLSLRDFTVNTLALSVTRPRAPLLDLFGGRRDLARRVIRVVKPRAFDEDPLRVLRAFSLSAALGFSITPQTRRLAARKRRGLSGVAGERLRDELFKILQAPDSWEFLKDLDREKILELVIPQVAVMHDVRQGGYHHLDVWGHSLETVRKLEELMRKSDSDADIKAYLDEELSANRRRRELIKLAALLHDIGKPEAFEVKAGKTMFHGHERIGKFLCREVAERLKLSTREKFALDTVIFWHLRPGYLADNKVLTPRAVFRYFRDTKEEALSVLLVAVADQRATRGPMASRVSRQRHERVAFGLIREYFRRQREEPFERLIGGNDLIRHLKLEPGPIFSKLLDAVEEAQVEGEIKTKSQALAWLRRYLKTARLEPEVKNQKPEKVDSR